MDGGPGRRLVLSQGVTDGSYSRVFKQKARLLPRHLCSYLCILCASKAECSSVPYH